MARGEVKKNYCFESVSGTCLAPPRMTRILTEANVKQEGVGGNGTSSRRDFWVSIQAI